MKQAFRFLALALPLLLCRPAMSQQSVSKNWGGPSFNLQQKAETKYSQRWTLQQWLDQKNRNYMMDLWLGMYSPSPYEFYVSGSMQSTDVTSTSTAAGSTDTHQSTQAYSGAAGAFAYLVGLEGEYQNNTVEGFNDLTGSINFRVLGNAVQGTHLILGYGERTRNMLGTAGPLRQQFAQADLDLYVMKAFGIHGLYRGFLPGTGDQNLGSVTGNQAEAGLFLDFGPLRVFGQWFTENQSFDKNFVTQTTQRTGLQSGLKIFF